MARWFPSAQRLRHLRALGIFPWSSLATRSIVLTLVAGVACARPELITALLSYSPTLEQSQSGLVQTLGIHWSSVLSLVVGTALGALVAGLTISLIQTRGACTWAALRSVRNRERRKNPFTSLLGLGVAFGIAYCLVSVLGPKLFLALRPPGSQPMAAYLGELLQYTAKLVVVASIVLAVVLLFVSRIAFLIGLKKRTRRMGADES